MHKTHVCYDTFLLLIPYITWSLTGVIIALLYYGRVSLVSHVVFNQCLLRTNTSLFVRPSPTSRLCLSHDAM